MSNWNASNYKQRKAARLLTVTPEWTVNPETSEEFYLRKVGGLMSSVLSGYLPAGLTSIAAEAWKEQGVEGLDSEKIAEFAATLTPEQREAGERETRSLAAIIQQACVIPLLSNNENVELSDEWKAAAIQGLKEQDKDFNEDAFDFRSLVFNPKDLDDKDTVFLFAWARGLAGSVSLKGGNVVSAGNFSPLHKKLNRGVRTGADQSAILKSA